MSSMKVPLGARRWHHVTIIKFGLAVHSSPRSQCTVSTGSPKFRCASHACLRGGGVGESPRFVALARSTSPAQWRTATNTEESLLTRKHDTITHTNA